MKKKIILIALAVVILGVGCAVGIPALVKSSRENRLIAEQNYVAAKLIELGDYDGGEQLALKSETVKPNLTAKQLIVLAKGFRADFETAVDCVTEWNSGSDEILTRAGELCEARLESVNTDELGGYAAYSGYVAYMTQSYVVDLDDETRKEFTNLLAKVRDSIKLKRDIASMQELVEAFSSDFSGPIPEGLKDDDSLIGKQVRIGYALASENYFEANEIAESLFNDDNSFANRALVANLTAFGGLEGYEDPVEPIKRAINFIETTTPPTEKSSAAYLLELAYLNYHVGDLKTAKQGLAEMLATEDTAPVGMLVSEMAALVDKLPASPYRESQLSSRFDDCTELLCLIDPNRNNIVYSDGYYVEYENEFITFFTDFLENYFRGIVIREIDTSDFPTVRVRLNLANDGDEKIGKRDFSLSDMDGKIGSLKLLSDSVKTTAESSSIMLVVDHSGSMGGGPMEDTKTAVESFVASVDASVRVGLTIFDDTAELLAAPDTMRTQVNAKLASVTADGGTNIYAGLETGLASLRGESGKKIIILLSDGADGSAGIIDQVLDKIVAEGVIVYTIGFGGADATYLQYIAEKCGGRYLYANASELLSEVYDSIGVSMANDYLIEFTAKSELEDYSRHLDVTVDKLLSSAGSDYHVGVRPEIITQNRELAPAYSPFRQIGGSGKVGG